MIGIIFSIIIPIILIVFLVVTLRILFVFLLRFKKNVVLNKSVGKSVFKGKLSLIIILLFFGISFAFVGGMQLLMKSGERSILEQYTKNNVYKYEISPGNIVDEGDDILWLLANEYDLEKGEDPSFKDFVNPDIVSYSYEKNLEKIYKEKYKIDLNIKPNPDGNEDYVPYDDFIKWLKANRSEYFKEIVPSDYLMLSVWEFKSQVKDQVEEVINADETYQNYYDVFFDSSFDNLNDFVIEREFNELISPLLDSTERGYYNITPKTNGNESYELVVFGRDAEQTVNKTESAEGDFNYSDFVTENNLSNDGKINVVVQQDYLDANDNKEVGGSLARVSGIDVHIDAGVRFSEVTFPTMGVNFLPDEEQQAFVGITWQDFIELKNSMNDSSYSSVYNRGMSYFYNFKGDNKKYSLKQWQGLTDNTFRNNRDEKLWDSFQDFNINNTLYEITPDELETLREEAPGEISYINMLATKKWNYDDNGNFLGGNADLTAFKSINDYSTPEAFRALIASIEISSWDKIMSVLVIIFMTIILIVLSMLISKRIKDSGKQLGTLKAMGMKNSQIASSYIIYPLLIVAMGFVIAALLSPIVMTLFTGVMKKYYYVTFAAFPLSFGFFWTLLFIPLILSIALSYFISIRTLRRPTLDLLSNKGKDAPNVLVRAAGYVTPSWTPFTISYAGKGVLRAIGKSSLLFLSVFLSVFLTSFAMSTTTMIKTQTNEVLSYLNFDAVSVGNNSNSGQYEQIKMYEDGTEDPIYYTDGTKEIVIGFDKDYLSTLSTDLEEANITYTNGSIEQSTGFYITSESMANLVVDTAIYHKPGAEYIDLYNSLTYMEELWLANSFSEINTYYKDEASELDINFDDNIWDIINDIKDFFENNASIIPKLPDVVFGNSYYNQYRRVVQPSTSLAVPQKSINNKDRQKFYESVLDGEFENAETSIDDSIMFPIMENKDDFLNSWGADDKKGQQLWDDNFAAADQLLQSNPTQLNYIPVIASTQSMLKIEDWSNTQFDGHNIVEQDGDGNYTLSARLDIKKKEDNDKYKLSSAPIQLKFRVEETKFLGMDFGFMTIKPFLDNYLENYLLPNFIGGSEESVTKYTEDEYNNPYDVMGTVKENDISNLYGAASSYSYRYSVDGRLSEQVKQGKSSPVSFTLKRKSYNEYWNNTDPPSDTLNMTINGSDLFDKTTDYYYQSNFGTSIGVWLDVDTILTQGAKVYDMMMGMFALMSIFIVFMATTVIVISMKDVIDSSKREVSMLKAFGYSNTKSTVLIMIPYVLISMLAFFIALPLTFAGLAVVAQILTAVTGNIFIFTLTPFQWILVVGYVYGLIGALTILGFISFSRTNALEAIRATDE